MSVLVSPVVDCQGILILRLNPFLTLFSYLTVNATTCEVTEYDILLDKTNS